MKSHKKLFTHILNNILLKNLHSCVSLVFEYVSFARSSGSSFLYKPMHYHWLPAFKWELKSLGSSLHIRSRFLMFYDSSIVYTCFTLNFTAVYHFVLLFCHLLFGGGGLSKASADFHINNTTPIILYHIRHMMHIKKMKSYFVTIAY